MREVLDELMQWWEAGETVGVGTVVATFRPPRDRPAPRCWSARTARPSARSPAAASRARSTSSASRVVESGAPVLERYGVSDDDAFAVGLTCGGILDVYVEKVNQQTFPELGEIAADIEAGRPVAAGHRDRAPGPRVGGPAGRRTPRGQDVRARSGSDPRRRRHPRRRARPARLRPQRDPDLRPRRRAARRGDAGLRLGVRAGPADAGLRRHRLRGRGRADGRRSSATTSRSATRGPCSRPTAGSRRPTRWWSSGRTSTSRPRATPAGSTAAR